MKKIFTLFAAMLLTLAVNAVTISKGENKLSAAIGEVTPGSTATIELNSGDYTETSAIAIVNKTITIKAANMAAKPVLKKIQFTISGGAIVKFHGIDMDADGITGDVITVSDAGANSLELDSCDIYSMGAHYTIFIDGGKHLDLLKVNHCYFHDANNSAIYTYSGSVHGCSRMEVKNSTFVNFTGFDKPIILSYSKTGASVSAEDDPILIVDHCTFYKFFKSNGSTSTYGFVDSRKSVNSTISNCIFVNPALPEGLTNANVTYTYGGTVSNCLDYGTTGTYKTTCTSRINQDPLFVNAAENNFRLKGNYVTGEVSPARGAATDGTDLGDPRWYTPITYPTTDFADPGYNFTADKAQLSGDILYETGGPNDPYLRYFHSQNPGEAKWVIQATRACYVSVTINMADNTWNYDASDAEKKYFQNHKHIFVVEVTKFEDDSSVDYVEEMSYETGWEDGKDTYPTVNMPGLICIPSAGVYNVKLKNARKESRCGVDSVTFTYVDDLRTVYLYPNMWSAEGAKYALWCYDSSNSLASSWSKFMTVAEGETSIYSTTIPASYATANFVRLKSTATTPNWDDKDNQTKNQTISDSKDYCAITDWKYSDSDKDSPCTMKKYNSALEDGSYYLIGIINGVEGWNEEDLTPARKFTADASAEVEDRMSVTAKLIVNDRIKAVSIANKMIQYWYPNDGDGWTIGANHTGNPQTVYLSPGGHGGTGWLNTVLFVPDNTATSIDNINAGEKAVKVLRNGQLFIEKDGKTYNVLGTVVK